jgi:hypothetical protein
MELLSDFLRKDRLKAQIDRSLEYFSGFFIRRNGSLILDAKWLEEPSSIAHSAFMILSLLHSQAPDRGRELFSLPRESWSNSARRTGPIKSSLEMSHQEVHHSGEVSIEVLNVTLSGRHVFMAQNQVFVDTLCVSAGILAKPLIFQGPQPDCRFIASNTNGEWPVASCISLN